MNKKGLEVRPNGNEVHRIGNCGERDNMFYVVYRKGLAKRRSTNGPWDYIFNARKEADGVEGFGVAS